LKQTKQFSVNSAEIKVSKVVFKSNAVSLEATGIAYDEKKEIATFTFESNLPLGEAHLHISFTGELNDKLKG